MKLHTITLAVTLIFVGTSTFGQTPENPPYNGDATADSTELITVAMVGDMMLGTTYPTKQLPANDGKNLFDDVGDILRSATIAVGN